MLILHCNDLQTNEKHLLARYFCVVFEQIQVQQINCLDPGEGFKFVIINNDRYFILLKMDCVEALTYVNTFEKMFREGLLLFYSFTLFGH